MKQIHILKTIQPYFDYVKSGKKKFELRKDDRDFNKNDTVILVEHDEQDSTKDDYIRFNIDYILRNAPQFGLMEGYCILSLSPITT